jgi:hypothetical protein
MGFAADGRFPESQFGPGTACLGALLPAANGAECLLLRLSFRPVYARVRSKPDIQNGPLLEKKHFVARNAISAVG